MLSATEQATLTSISNLAAKRGASVKTSALSAPGYDAKQLYNTIPSLVKMGLVVKTIITREMEVEKVRYIAMTELGYQVLEQIQNPIAVAV